MVFTLAKGDLLVLLAAFLSFLFSISLWFGVGMTANKGAGMFAGIWVPSIISLGAFFHVAMRKPQLTQDSLIFISTGVDPPDV